MTESREFYALTVEEAVDKASAALGVDRDRLEFLVVDEGSAGFLGIGARDARITVRSAAVASDETAIEETPDEVGLSGSGTAVADSSHRPEGAAVDSEVKSAEVQVAPVELILATDRFATDLIEAMGF